MVLEYCGWMKNMWKRKRLQKFAHDYRKIENLGYRKHRHEIVDETKMNSKEFFIEKELVIKVIWTEEKQQHINLEQNKYSDNMLLW